MNKTHFAILVASFLFSCNKVVTTPGVNERQPKPVTATKSERPVMADTASDKKTFKFDSEEVVGYLDNPTPVYAIPEERNSTDNGHEEESKSSEPERTYPDIKKEELLKKIQELEKNRYHLKSGRSKSTMSSSSGGLDEEIKDRAAEEGTKKSIMAVRAGASAANVKAASHDDNEEFAAYIKYCKGVSLSVSKMWFVDKRYVLRVVDQNNLPVPGKLVSLFRKNKSVWSATTPASGEIMLFPYIDLDKEYSSITEYSIEIDKKSYKIEPAEDSYITVQLDSPRKLKAELPVQVCFLLDATGSMSDEIQLLKDVIYSIHSRLLSHPSKPKIEFSVVAYRDRSDDYLVKGTPFTSNIDSFQIRLEAIQADGGGDEPEDLDAGLQYVIDSLKWNKDAVKFVFLIADAPPHLDYNNKKDYLWASWTAREKAIMITPVGASGLKELGEFIFRQMAVITNGEFVFLHYGEKGESSGAGTVADPGKVSHHTGSNYNARRLDDIVIDIITKELGYLVANASLVQMQYKPEDESDLLDIRLTDLLVQVFRSDLTLSGKTVALAPFCVLDTSLKATSEFLWETALEKTMQLAPVKVLERARLEELLKEHALELSGLMVENPDPKIGKMLSADYLVFGKIHYIGAVRVCHMRLVDCTTGNVVSASRIKL